jgi:hypothetical protein
LKKEVDDSAMASEACKGGVCFNRIYRRAFIKWQAQMEADLRSQGYNTITSAWTKVGLGLELDKGCEMWTAAIRLFGAASILGLARQAVNVAAAAAAQAAAEGDQGGVGAAGEGGVGATPAADQGGDRVTAMHARNVTAVERLDAEKKDRLLTLLRNLSVGDCVALGHHEQLPHEEVAEPGMTTHKPARPKKAATAVGALSLVRITPRDKHENEIELTHEQLKDALDPDVVRVCAAYEIFVDRAAINQEDAKRRKKVKAKERRLQRVAIAEQARNQYNSDWAEEQKWLLDALLLLFTPDGFTVGNEAQVRLEETVKQHMERTRELAERPPCRVINGHLVYDAVGLVEPLVLTRALMDAVGAGLAQRAAAAVEQAAKPKRIKKHDAPQDRPNNYAGTTGAAAAAHLEKRDKQRADDRSADAQKKANAQAKRDAKKAAEEAKLKENAVVALNVLIAHAGRFSSTALSRQRRCLLLRCYGAEIPGGGKVLPSNGTMDEAAEAAWAAVKPKNLPAALLLLERDAKAAAAAVAALGAGASTAQVDATANAARAEDGAESEGGKEGEEGIVDEEEEEEEEDEDEDEDEDDEDEDEGEADCAMGPEKGVAGGLRVTTRSSALKAAAAVVFDDDDSEEEEDEDEDEDQDEDEDNMDEDEDEDE